MKFMQADSGATILKTPNFSVQQEGQANRNIGAEHVDRD